MDRRTEPLVYHVAAQETSLEMMDYALTKAWLLEKKKTKICQKKS